MVVERPTRETRAEQYSLTLQSLFSPPKKARIFPSAEPLKSLEMKTKAHKKERKIAKKKKK